MQILGVNDIRIVLDARFDLLELVGLLDGGLRIALRR
jgi:hypothetical protein